MRAGDSIPSRAIGDLFSFLISCSLDNAPGGSGECDFATIFEDVQAGRDESQAFEGRGCIEDKEAVRFVLFDAIAILDAQCSGGIGGNQVKYVVDLFVTAHVAEEERKLGGGEHIAPAEREPGVHDRIVPKGDVDAGGE